MSFNFMAAVTVRRDFGARENEVWHCFHFHPSVCYEGLGPDDMTACIIMMKRVRRRSLYLFPTERLWIFFFNLFLAAAGLCWTSWVAQQYRTPLPIREAQESWV